MSLCGAASQTSKAQMPRCGSGSRTNPPVFSGGNTGKSLKPPPVVGPADQDGNANPVSLAESLAPVRRCCAAAVPVMCLVLPAAVDPTAPGSAAANSSRTRRSRQCGAGIRSSPWIARRRSSPLTVRAHRPRPCSGAGWFTLCAVIALILSELIVDHQAARFGIFAGLTLASIWLSIAVRQLPHRVRSCWVRVRGVYQPGNPTDD